MSTTMKAVVFILAVIIHLALAKTLSKPKANSIKITHQRPPTGGATKILGGTMADSKYVKGSALIYYGIESEYYGVEYYSVCSGSVLGSKWILTAAHCVTDAYGYFDYATYGAIPATKFATLKEIYDYGSPAANVYIHKNYYGSGTYEFDVALLELAWEIPSYRYTKVSLVRPPKNDKVTVKAVGYGLTDVNGGPDLTDPLRLMMTDMKYRKYDWCKEEDALRNSPVQDQMVCATSLNWPTGDTGVCYGDSGGPLFKITKNSKLLQFGLLSYGNSYICGDYAAFDWFVQVSHVKNAIAKKNTNYWNIYEQTNWAFSSGGGSGSGSGSGNSNGRSPPNRRGTPNHWSRK